MILNGSWRNKRTKSICLMIPVLIREIRGLIISSPWKIGPQADPGSPQGAFSLFSNGSSQIFKESWDRLFSIKNDDLLGDDIFARTGCLRSRALVATWDGGRAGVRCGCAGFVLTGCTGWGRITALTRRAGFMWQTGPLRPGHL